MSSRPTATKGPYAIMRLEPLKDWRSLRAAAKHNDRTWLSENVDAGKPPPRSLIHADLLDVVELARDKLKLCGTDKPEAGKNLAYEVVVTASPAWFRNASPDEYKQWRDTNVTWLKKLAGTGLLDIVEHLDEETPHLHALALPLIQKTGKTRGPKPKDPEKRRLRELEEAAQPPRWTLSYHDLFGGHRRTLEKLQDRYHAAVAHFGLQRGEKGRQDSEVDLGDGLKVSSDRFSDSRGNRKNVRPPEYRQMLIELEGKVRCKEACLAVASFARVIGMALERDAKAEEQRKLSAASARLAKDREASEQLAREQAAERLRLERLAHANAEREARTAAQEDRLSRKEQRLDYTGAQVERLESEASVMMSAASAAAAQARLADEEAGLRLSDAMRAEHRATLAADSARREIKLMRQEEERLAVERAQLGAAFNLLERGIDDENGLRFRPQEQEERGFLMEAHKLRPDEAQVYSKWPKALRMIAMRLAKMIEAARTIRDTLLGREKELDKRQAAMEERERQFSHAEEQQRGEAEWSELFRLLTIGQIEIRQGPDQGAIAEGPGGRPVEAWVQDRLKADRPAWVSNVFQIFSAVEDAAAQLEQEQREASRYLTELKKVVEQAEKAFTPEQTQAVNAAKQALSSEAMQQAALREAQLGTGRG